jgi:hypothetical protein
MRRGVVFDFDGVLADSEGLHLAAFQDVLSARGWTLARATYFDRISATTTAICSRHFLRPQSSVPEAELDAMWPRMDAGTTPACRQQHPCFRGGRPAWRGSGVLRSANSSALCTGDPPTFCANNLETPSR